jgi:hypothetical protein
MLNAKPNNANYNSGLYVPQNKNKVLKLNEKGGLYYRSSWEKKIMIYLDMKEEIVMWGAEGLEIPYASQEYDRDAQMVRTKHRRYYPDFYYKIKSADGSIKEVIAEVKPMKEVKDVEMFNEGKFHIPNNLNSKRLKNLEYQFKMAQKNSSKWKAMEEFSLKKGMKFIIITEDFINRISQLK